MRDDGTLLHVELESFRGPLDLLLHLIRNQDLDIFDIPIARITAQFLHAIREMERWELDRAGEFLELAATLLRIKAQLLFPRPETPDEEEDPRAELVRRLLEYEHFGEVARHLARSEAERARRYAREFAELRPARTVPPPLETEWSELWAAAVALEGRTTAPEPEVRIGAQPVRVEEKLELVMGALRRRPRVEFSALVAPWGTSLHAAVSLLACLELAKRHRLRLRQAMPFAPLWLLRRSEAA